MYYDGIIVFFFFLVIICLLAKLLFSFAFYSSIINGLLNNIFSNISRKQLKNCTQYELNKLQKFTQYNYDNFKKTLERNLFLWLGIKQSMISRYAFISNNRGQPFKQTNTLILCWILQLKNPKSVIPCITLLNTILISIDHYESYNA